MGKIVKKVKKWEMGGLMKRDKGGGYGGGVGVVKGEGGWGCEVEEGEIK